MALVAEDGLIQHWSNFVFIEWSKSTGYQQKINRYQPYQAENNMMPAKLIFIPIHYNYRNAGLRMLMEAEVVLTVMS